MLSLLRVLFLQLDLWIIPAFNYIFMIWVCGFYNILEIIYYYFIIINHYTGIFTYFLLFYLSISRYINLFVLKAFLIDFLKLSLFMPLILYILKNGYIYILDSLYIELSSRGVSLPRTKRIEDLAPHSLFFLVLGAAFLFPRNQSKPKLPIQGFYLCFSPGSR